MPASGERDALIANSMSENGKRSRNERESLTSEFSAPVRAAQSTIASLQQRLKQKEMTVLKYQDMLKLARDEISQVDRLWNVEPFVLVFYLIRG
jgi:hypothetical protein